MSEITKQEQVAHQTQEIQTGWRSYRRAIGAISLAASVGLGVVIGHEVWPSEPKGLTTHISISGTTEQFRITNSNVNADGSSAPDVLLAGTIDCQKMVAHDWAGAVELTYIPSTAESEQIGVFKQGVESACDYTQPLDDSGWDITQAYGQSGIGNSEYLR